ncbi:MAG: ATP-binding protein [Myxococcaceae bacterium]
MWSWLWDLGRAEPESDAQTLDRHVVVLGGTLMSLGGVVWGALALSQGLVAASIIPLGYGVLTALNLVSLRRTRRVASARVLQVLLSLALPFFFQWSLGGFIKSGGVMLWATIALVGSLTFGERRQSITWLAMFCLLTLITGAFDDWFSRHVAFTPSPVVVRVFFVVNMVCISSIVFLLALVLTSRQRALIAELSLERTVTGKLTGQLREALEGSERDVRLLREAEAQLRDLSADLAARVEERTRELRGALDHAWEATRAKDAFLAVMSHELRTPLNGILATADLLCDGAGRDSPERDSLKLIRRSGELLLTILNDVLDFSKIEAGQLKLVERAFDLRAEVETVVALHRAVAQQKGLELRVSWPAVLPELVRGDPVRVVQVIGNLLANALKFTDQGVVTLALALNPDGERHRLHVVVSDTGIGMGPDTVARLFRPFSQADASQTRRFGGTGLGLSICARLVEQMGGAFVVSTRPGRGSTFACELQLKRETAAPRVTITPAPSAPRAQRVLLVEDNPVNQTIGRRILERFGCEVTSAFDGRQAVEMLQSASFDVVLMDLQMPVLDGLGAAREIRALPLSPQPWIIAVTANAYDSDRAASFDAGMDAFLPKPLRLDELKAALASVPPTRRAS